MPIERTRKPKVDDSVADVPSGPSQLIELRDLDFNFGPDDMASFTLGPNDTFTEDAVSICIHMEGEVVEIDRTRVRWRSTRTRMVAVPPALYIPEEPRDA